MIKIGGQEELPSTSKSKMGGILSRPSTPFVKFGKNPDRRSTSYIKTNGIRARPSTPYVKQSGKRVTLSNPYNYDNCIITTHDDSSSEGFTLDLESVQNSEKSFVTQTLDIEKISPSSVNLGGHNCYILVMGFMNKIERFLKCVKVDDQHTQELREFLEDLDLLKDILSRNYRAFGVPEKSNQTVSEIENDETQNAETVIFNDVQEHEKINGITPFKTMKRAVHKEQMQKTSTPMNGQTKARKQKKNAETSIQYSDVLENEKNDFAPLKTKETAKRKRQTQKTSTPKVASVMNGESNDVCRESSVTKKRKATRQVSVNTKRRRISYIFQHSRLAMTKSRIQEVITGFNHNQTVTAEKQKTAAKKKSLSQSCIVPEKSSQTDAMSTGTSKGTELHNGVNPSINKSVGKRKLYSVESWLETLNSILPDGGNEKCNLSV